MIPTCTTHNALADCVREVKPTTGDTHQKRKHGSSIPVQALRFAYNMPRFDQRRASRRVLPRGDDGDNFAAVVRHARYGLHHYPSVLVAVVVAVGVERTAAARELGKRHFAGARRGEVFQWANVISGDVVSLRAYSCGDCFFVCIKGSTSRNNLRVRLRAIGHRANVPHSLLHARNLNERK